LKKEERRRQNLQLQLDAGGNAPARKKAYLMVDMRIQNLTRRYANQEITRQDFLRSIAYNLA